MSLWRFLGGQVNHERVAKWNQKQEQANINRLRLVCKAIMSDGMPGAFNDTVVTEENAKYVLNQFSTCPQFDNWGKREYHINNWKQAQIWLHNLEHNKDNDVTQKELADMKQKLKDLENKLAQFEK